MRTIAAVAVAALLVTAAPVVAEEEVIPTEPCEASEEGATLGLDGITEAVTPSPVPATPYDILSDVEPMTYNEASAVTYRYRLDVSGSETVPEATMGNVTLTLGWDNDGDYDLFVYDADGNLLGESTAFNPTSGAGETVALSRVAHCTDLRVDIVNYLAPGPLTTMELNGRVSQLRP